MTARLRIAAAAAAAIALAAPGPARAASPALRTLQTSFLNRLDRATRSGRAPGSTVLRIGVALQRPDVAGEMRLLHDLYDPASPSFHRFLTPAQFKARFGVPAASVAATQAWLRGAGLHVDSTDASGDYLLASGTVAQVERLTHTRLGSYRFQHAWFVANEQPPRVPARLPILTLVGLNTFERHHTMLAERGTLGPRLKLAAAGTPNVGAQTPQDLWSIYEQPPDQTGQGVSVAILGNGATDSVIADLHTFDEKNGLPKLPVEVVRTPANGTFDDTSGNPEWNIDMQAIHGMAPGISKEVLYFAPTLADTELVASTAAWVNDPDGPPIMNASLGECEVTPLNDVLNNPALFPINGNENTSPAPVAQGISNSSEPAQTQVLRQAVLEGRQFFAASGDAGSSCTMIYPGTNGIGNYAVPLTEDPANNPYATGVGGTVLYSDGNQPAGRAFEYAWTHSGGNSSPFITAPSYQQGVSGIDRPCLMDQTGQPTNTGQTCRAVPDVAALSGDVLSNGYTIVSDGKDSQGGGTSLSSPLWAGMWARLVGTAPPGSTGYGFANEALYMLAKDRARYGAAFHDITIGTNGLNPALPGYDYVTGLGVPRLAGLIQQVQQVAPAVPATATTTSAASSTGAARRTPATTTTKRTARKHAKAKRHGSKRRARSHRRRHTSRRRTSRRHTTKRRTSHRTSRRHTTKRHTADRPGSKRRTMRAG